MPAPVTTLLIVNPKAARASRIFPAVRERLKAAGIPFEIHKTRAAGDASGATTDALRQGYLNIVAVGGDGTISETANGFFDLSGAEPRAVAPEAVLAIIPAGTGNDFARGLGGQATRSPDEWLDHLVAYLQTGGASAGSLRPVAISSAPIDVIYGISDGGAQHFIALNASTLGLGPEAAAAVGRQTALLQLLPGSARFTLAAIGALVRWRERFVRVTIDNNPPLKCQTNLLGAANNRFAGGGMMLAPDARVDDGNFDFLLACGLTRTGIARELKRIRHGGHLLNPCVRIFAAERVKIEALTADDVLLVEADGNPRGHTPVEFLLIPRALRVLRPEYGYVFNELIDERVHQLDASPA
jgi:diacylglycerol kinase (ATP)